MQSSLKLDLTGALSQRAVESAANIFSKVPTVINLRTQETRRHHMFEPSIRLVKISEIRPSGQLIVATTDGNFEKQFIAIMQQGQTVVSWRNYLTQTTLKSVGADSVVFILDHDSLSPSKIERIYTWRRDLNSSIRFIHVFDESKACESASLVGSSDEVLISPFHTSKLLAVLDRLNFAYSFNRIETFPKIRLDDEGQRVLRNGVAVDLSPREFRLVFLLLRYCGTLVKYEDLRDFVWDGVPVRASTFSTVVHNLIEKLGIDRMQIDTVAGEGLLLHC